MEGEGGRGIFYFLSLFVIKCSGLSLEVSLLGENSCRCPLW